MGFTNLSFNNISITLYKVLEVQHDKELNTFFYTIIYQPYTYNFFTILEILHSIKFRTAGVFYQPLTIT